MCVVKLERAIHNSDWAVSEPNPPFEGVGLQNLKLDPCSVMIRMEGARIFVHTPLNPKPLNPKPYNPNYTPF